MDATDVTVKILREIRDGIRQTNERLDQTNERLDQTNERLDQTRSELSARIDETNRRIVDSEVRTATAIAGLSGTLLDVKQLLREALDLRPRVEICEHEIEQIKRRIEPST